MYFLFDRGSSLQQFDIIWIIFCKQVHNMNNVWTWKCSFCSGVVDTVPVCFPIWSSTLSIYYSCLAQYMKTQNYFCCHTITSQCTACPERATYPPSRPGSQEKQQSDSWVHKQILFSAMLWSFLIPCWVCKDKVGSANGFLSINGWFGECLVLEQGIWVIKLPCCLQSWSGLLSSVPLVFAPVTVNG